MAYGIFLKLDIGSWRAGDYSATNKLTGTIYSEKEKISPFNLTGYTLKVRIYKRWRDQDYFNKTASIVTAASGTWSYAVGSGEMPPFGIYLVEIELSKSGEVMSTEPIEFLVTGSPS